MFRCYFEWNIAQCLVHFYFYSFFNLFYFVYESEWQTRAFFFIVFPFLFEDPPLFFFRGRNAPYSGVFPEPFAVTFFQGRKKCLLIFENILHASSRQSKKGRVPRHFFLSDASCVPPANVWRIDRVDIRMFVHFYGWSLLVMNFFVSDNLCRHLFVTGFQSPLLFRYLKSLSHQLASFTLLFIFR